VKATVTIEITDNTTTEDLAKCCMTCESVRQLYEKTFTDLMEIASKGCQYTVAVQVQDNTKEG
jgi:hypothetical protein